MARRRRRRNPSGFDPVPWVIGAILAGAAYELFKTISSGTPAPTGANGLPLTTGSTPGQGGGADW
jgi:hypothetical protein